MYEGICSGTDSGSTTTRQPNLPKFLKGEKKHSVSERFSKEQKHHS